MNILNDMVFSPKDYTDAAVIARAAGDEMLSRLALMTIQPKTILDVGCGTGEMSAKLKMRYPEAHIIALDLSLPMVQHAKRELPDLPVICGDGSQLPLPDRSIDLIFANFFLPWQVDVKGVMVEWARVLRTEGLLMLSGLGIDTFQERRDIFAIHEMPCFVDMHDVGDALIQSGFSDPVLDVDYYHVTYQNKERLLQDVRAAGMWYPDAERDLKQVTIPKADSLRGWQLTYEVIYAHAFGAPVKNEFGVNEEGVVKIPLSHLRKVSSRA